MTEVAHDIQLQVSKYKEKNWDLLTHTIPGMVRLILYDGHNKLIATISNRHQECSKNNEKYYRRNCEGQRHQVVSRTVR